jgi:myo-inositol-1(or 4)-monophosphatase
MGLPEADWLASCRRAARAARDAVASFETTAERALETGRGEGGDTSLVIDRAAEEAILAEFETLAVPVTVVTEERGELELSGGGPVRVVVDPVDGSLNAKRGLPSACVSIAVAGGAGMGDVEIGYVAELDRPRAWWAVRGQGAWCDGRALARLEPGPLEVLGLETARPRLVAEAADAILAVEARRLRVLGSVALSLCMVAAGKLDAMVTLRGVRSVDVAAGQLLVREAGGAVALPGGDRLDLDMRSRMVAARDPSLLARLEREFEGPARDPSGFPPPSPGTRTS